MSLALDHSRDKTDTVFIVGVFVLSRVIVFLTLAAALAIRPEMGGDGTLAAMCRWDCIWYVELARDGYHPTAQLWTSGSAANWAFFPALPLLLRFAHAVFGGDLMVVSVLAMQAVFLLTLFIFHAYAAEVAPAGDAQFARFATALVAAWPFSIYFSVPMSEAIFLPLSLLALLLARRDHWLLAGCVGALLSGSRIVGILIVPALLTLALQRFGWKALATLRPGTERVILALALCGLGLGVFVLHLHQTTGDALAFLHVQVAWLREFKWPWMMLLDELNPLVQAWDRVVLNLGFAVAGAVALGLLALLWRRHEGLLPEFVLAASVTAVALTGGRLMSLPRILGVLFPLMLVVALAVRTPQGRIRALAVSGLCSIALMMVLFLERSLGLWAEFAM